MNLFQIVQETKETQGEFVIYVLNPLVFKNLALGLEEIKRYIKQTNEIIEYYEKSLTEE